ncbi:MAG TPA: sigma-70 family RNA polymerase sigma factor [Hyphomicrobiaceae bacterium]|nr:sigma-70 family RNA polymerase sigma factor [Hyphomicrobiaceae bacterium]
MRRAIEGDKLAFVELTRRFQLFAFGSALAHVGDFQKAEDIVQEAFVAAWLALPTLAEPAAFPGWLRGIVRHQAFRVLRRNHVHTVPLTEAEALPSDEQPADYILEQRRQAAAALAAISELPDALREPATLFFIHECSHQDIATFLGLPVATVNNRLHAARSRLKRRIVKMASTTLNARTFPDDFANRIGRLIEARGDMIEVLFDPASLPDLMTELTVSDEAHKQGVTVQVMQRPGGGVVRGIAASPIEARARGATVLNERRRSIAPLDRAQLDRLLPLLTRSTDEIVETGIKVIDVMCPIRAGGSVALAGENGAGTTVVMEEIVRRISKGGHPVTLFVLFPPPSELWPPSLDPSYSIADQLKKEGFSEGTVGTVQTFFVGGKKGPWTAEELDSFAPVDTLIHLSRQMILRKTYPGVDVMTTRARLLDDELLKREDIAIARGVRDVIGALRAADENPAVVSDPILVERARKLQAFFSQPFFVAEPYTKRPGSHVSRADALRGCHEILEGRHDDLPAAAFYFTGSIEEIRRAAGSS